MSRRSFLGGALATTLAAAAAATTATTLRGHSRPDTREPALPMWIGHL